MSVRRIVVVCVLLSASVLVFAQRAPAPIPAGVKLEANVLVPMRDGVRLAADVYRPDREGKFPVMLSRTPYNKDGQRALASFFAQNGYATVVMDSRGLYASHGQWHPYVDEAQDGFDTQQWIGQQAWCDGKIGMFGTSYPGFTQLLPAPYRSSFVKAIMPIAAQSEETEQDIRVANQVILHDSAHPSELVLPVIPR